jgi:hypothetical protein
MYNNFQRRRIFQLPSSDVESTPHTADFSHIEDLYHRESTMLLRIAHKLTPTVLNPTNIQRSSAQMMVSLFHESTVAGLQHYCEQENKPWRGTLAFVKYMMEVWKIINVKSSTIGFHKKDNLREVVSSSTDEKLLFLECHHDFLSSWENSKKKGPSHETFLALRLMCLTLVAVSKYLIDIKGFRYVLLGQLQSDPLERRFGRYRQMSGANFFVSFKQICESEKRLKVASSLKHSGLTVNDLKSISDDDAYSLSFDKVDHKVADKLSANVSFLAIDLEPNELNIIYFCAGYVVRHLSRARACESCLQVIWDSQNNAPSFELPIPVESTLLDATNRGGLLSPIAQCYLLCSLAYITFSQLKASADFETKFLLAKDSCALFIDIVIKATENSEYSVLLEGKCNQNHLTVTILQRTLSCFFNILAKKFVQDKNASIVPCNGSRKIAKLSSALAI